MLSVWYAFSIFCFLPPRYHRYLHSFPTRRSSDLLLLIQAVSQRRGRGFVDDALHIQAGDASGVFGCLALGVVERSEEHTSELQSHSDLVCRLLLEKKNRNPHFHW